MKKKLLVFALVAGMVLSLTACGSKGDDSAAAETPVQSSEAEVQEEASAPEEEESASEEPAEQEEASEPEEEATMTLDEWMQSDEAKQTEDLTNTYLAASDITVKFKADGNVFVYEYTMPDIVSEMSEEDMEAGFNSIIEQNEASVASLYETFDTSYGIKLEGLRFVFLASDGTELYSKEITNE